MSNDCIFCQIVAGQAPSAPIAETESTFAFMDIQPGSDGHLLVVPKRHSTDLRDIPADDLAEVALEAQRIAKHAYSAWDADGVNLLNCCGADAWQTVFHFHMHLIPRYIGDGNEERLGWNYAGLSAEEIAEICKELDMR